MEKRVPKGRKMWTVQIDENGGVHIPKEALALIGLKAGESAVLTGDKRRGLVLVAESRAESVQEAFLKTKNKLGAEEFSALILRKFACRSCVRRVAALPSRGKVKLRKKSGALGI